MVSPPTDAAPPDPESSSVALPVHHRPRRPVLAPTLAYMVGILAAAALTLPPLPYLLVAAAFLLVAVAGSRRAWSLPCLYAAAAAVGAAHLTLVTGTWRSDHLNASIRRDRESMAVEVCITDMPQRTVREGTGRTNWVFHAEVVGSFDGDLRRPATGIVRVQLPVDIQTDPAYGDRWMLRGTYRRDLRPVMYSRGIAGLLQADAARSLRVASDEGHPLVAWCYRQRAAAHARLGWGLAEDRPSVALSRALLLGYRQDVARPVYDAFLQTGTLHVLALSGMHVGILVLLLVVVLKAAGINRPAWVLFFAPILILYTVGTGAAASMVRATVMAMVYYSAFLFRRRPDPLTSLAVAALFILAADPVQLFSLGFLLSFVAVGGLVTVHPRLVAWMERRFSDPWADETDGWRAHAAWWRHVAAGAIALSVSAWIATLPLVASLSHLISPVALVVNLAMGPLSFLLLLTGCLSVLASMVLPAAAIVFNHANDAFSIVLLALIETSARWPGAYFYVAAWPVVAIMAWYALLAVCLAAPAWPRRIAVAAMCILVAGSLTQRKWSREVEAVAIPGGDALSLLIDGPGDRAVLIDAGSSYNSRYLIDALRARGINRLDALWISRATANAYGGVRDLARAMPVHALILPETTTRHAGFHAAAASWRAFLPDGVIGYWSTHDRVTYEGDLVLRILHPLPGAPYVDARRSSLVLHVSRGARSVLFAGRADHVMEAELLQRPVDWSADGLVVGYAQDPHALSTDWLRLVQPAAVHINTRSFERMTFGPGLLLDRIARLTGHSADILQQEPRVWTF